MEKILPSIVKKIAPKTFVNDSSEHYISTVLKQNGWTEVNKANSSWQLKWTWKAESKEIENMQQNQAINHYAGIQEVTTKIGLTLLLKRNQLISDEGKSYSNFYPRSYNLNSEHEDFVQDFIRTGILNLLKKIIACLEVYFQSQFQQSRKQMINLGRNGSHYYLREILQNQSLFIQFNPSRFKIDSKMLIRLLFYLEHLFSLDSFYQFEQEELQELMQYSEQDIPFTGRNLECPSNQSLALLLHFHQLCLKSYPSFYQDGFGNVWILKSNYSSRGRSIQLADSLSQIRSISNGMKLIQKYIENVWILQSLTNREYEKYPEMEIAVGRKFDIRFWVLIKSYSPLEIYFYEEGYLRLSSQNYNLETIQDNRCHLTNYSTNWRKSKLKQIQKENSYILFTQFLSFLTQHQGINPDALLNRIKTICLETLKVADLKQNRKSFQLLGFDIILDAKCNPWLLECNMSPSCAPRGKLAKVAKQMAEGMFSILGFIDSSHHQWTCLFNESTENNMFEPERRNYNFMNQTGFAQPLQVRPLKWSKYKSLEKNHFLIEQLMKIQAFYKKRIQNRELSSTKTSFSCAIIQALAKMVKKRKQKCLKILIRKVRRIKRLRLSF